MLIIEIYKYVFLGTAAAGPPPATDPAAERQARLNFLARLQASAAATRKPASSTSSYAGSSQTTSTISKSGTQPYSSLFYLHL